MFVEKPRVGFIGLGSLGEPIARRIAGTFSVIAFDRDPNRGKKLADIASIAGSGAEVGERADLVFACLGPEVDYRAALFGPRGLSHGKRVRTYVHLGTSGPALVQEFASLLEKSNVAFVDGPVTGGPPLARTGSLTAMVSGASESLRHAAPAVVTFATRVIEAGHNAGDAQAVKLVNNAIALTNLTVACEALMVGAKRGLDPAMMLEVINHGSGQNSATLTKVPQQILTRQFNFGASLATVIKDLELFQEEASKLAMPSPISDMALEAFRQALAAGVEVDDLTSVIRPLERMAAVELRPTAPAS